MVKPVSGLRNFDVIRDLNNEKVEKKYNEYDKL